MGNDYYPCALCPQVILESAGFPCCKGCRREFCEKCGEAMSVKFGGEANGPNKCTKCDPLAKQGLRDDKIDEVLDWIEDDWEGKDDDVMSALDRLRGALRNARETRDEESDEEEPEKRKAEAVVEGEPDTKRQKVEN